MDETLYAAIVTPAVDIDAPARERIGRLFDTHHERLYRLARRLSRDPEDARDLVQETFLRVARNPSGVPPGGSSQEAWLVRILINLCRDSKRRRAVRERFRPGPGPAATDVANPESAALSRATVQKALSRLPARRRAMVILHDLEGLPVERIARMLRVARVTVRWHLSLARKELFTFLSADPGRSAGGDPEP